MLKHLRENVWTQLEDREIAFAMLAGLVAELAVVTLLLIRFAERIGRRLPRRS